MNYTFKTAGDGLWGCEAGRTVTITGFDIQYWDDELLEDFDIDDDRYRAGDIFHVTVEHDSTWNVYTDSGFVEAARRVTGIPSLDFTEQGMQDDGAASME